MARVRQFAQNVGSSYGALAVTVVYTLISVPLALNFLSKEAFGLWALLAQVTAYLLLIDLGLTASATRLLIDYKDERASGAYGSMVKTSFLVALVQGCLILGAGFFLAPFCSRLVGLSPEFSSIFVELLRWLAAITAFGFVTRPFGQMLGAYQRLDLINYGHIVQSIVGLVCVWLFLRSGYGLSSFVFASAISLLVNAVYLFVGCLLLRLIPWQDKAAPSWGRFKEIFGFGKDLFLVSLGAQLIMASQVVIVTRSLGLEAAAVWAVGIRMFTLLCQIIWRVSDSASATFAEMISRGEQERLKRRYQEIVMVSASLAGAGAVIFAASNSAFITLWTSGKITWHPLNDVLLGIWSILLALIHCHCGFVLLTKKVGFMRWVYFAEGLVFVILSLVFLREGEIPLMIGISIFSGFALSGSYGVYRVMRYFSLPLRDVVIGWLAPMGRVLVWIVPAALLLYFGLRWASPVVRFALTLGVLSLWSAWVVGHCGLPETVRREILERAPRYARPIMQRLFAGR